MTEKETTAAHGKTIADVVREFWPDADDAFVQFVAWNETSFPFVPNNEIVHPQDPYPEQYFRDQVAAAHERIGDQTSYPVVVEGGKKE